MHNGCPIGELFGTLSNQGSVRDISVWLIRSGRLGLAISVTGLFGQGHFSRGTFRSDYEIL